MKISLTVPHPRLSDPKNSKFSPNWLSHLDLC